jgi:predicted exporter
MSFVIRIYDYLKARRGVCLTVLLLLTVVLVALLSRQRYKEDISDFLPLDSKYGQALKVYQEISGASRIVAIVSRQRFPALHPDIIDSESSSPDSLIAAVDAFSAIVAERDTTGIASTITSQIDVEQVETIMQFLYANMPYFLTDRDYARMDSLLGVEGFVEKQLATDKQTLMLPMAGMMAQNVQRDPLNLFTPVTASLQQSSSVSYENYDGYIFTPDMSRAIVLMQSPYGGSETNQNARLLRFLEECAADVDVSGVDIHFTGGPVIAVGNAEQIKSDSILAGSLALILIVALLFFVFRSVRNLALIVVSIGWGWLFAMGALALIHNNVSVIVIGISSVILGIAVNYPLHLIAHLRHTPSVRQAMREIVAPLIVGNITTVGAFLALVPLESVALRDLGLFSSLLLVGTILFVLIFLPQIVRPTPQQPLPPAPPCREGSRYFCR